uniref:Uncharacterized protein n=1 Tax=Arundo donax TaxID=35708 RepID=A0A0A9FGC3_ARUDO
MPTNQGTLQFMPICIRCKKIQKTKNNITKYIIRFPRITRKIPSLIISGQ